MRTNISLVYTIEEVDTIVDRVWNWKYMKAHQKATPQQVVGTGLNTWAEVRYYVGERWGLSMTPVGLKMRTNKLYSKLYKFRREFVPDSNTVWKVSALSHYSAIGYVSSSSKVGAENTAFTLYGWSLAGDQEPRPDMFVAEWVGIGGWEEVRKRNVDVAMETQSRISRWERELETTRRQIEKARARATALLTLGEGLESREAEQKAG